MELERARENLVRLTEEMLMEVQYAEMGSKHKARKEFAENLIDTILFAIKVHNLVNKEKKNERKN